MFLTSCDRAFTDSTPDIPPASMMTPTGEGRPSHSQGGMWSRFARAKSRKKRQWSAGSRQICGCVQCASLSGASRVAGFVEFALRDGKASSLTRDISASGLFALVGQSFERLGGDVTHSVKDVVCTGIDRLDPFASADRASVHGQDLIRVVRHVVIPSPPERDCRTLPRNPPGAQVPNSHRRFPSGGVQAWL